MKVLLAVALPDRQEVMPLELPEDATVDDALRISRIAERFPEIDFSAARVGIWSRACERGQRLRDGDRVEVYRSLQADAKAQRRERARLKPSTRSRNAP